GAQPHVYPKDIEQLELDIPSLNEQQKIATVLSTADREIEILTQKLSYLKQEKKALMQQLLTGKRRVKIKK
ncbi:MAG: type I restriction enzyme S subunit, partial [Phenylobacterium sp.]